MKTAQKIESGKSIYEKIALNCMGDAQCQGNSVHDIRQWLLGYMSQKLGLEDDQLDDQEEFSRYFSSLEMMELLGDLEKKLDRRLTPGIIIHYPNIAMLAQHLSG
jgi:acyl carrier protein